MRGMTSHDSSVIVIRVTDDVRVAQLGSSSSHKHNVVKKSMIDRPWLWRSNLGL